MHNPSLPQPCPGNAPYHIGFHPGHFNQLLHLKDKAATGQLWGLGEAGGVISSYQAIFKEHQISLPVKQAPQWRLNGHHTSPTKNRSLQSHDQHQGFSDVSQGRKTTQEAALPEQWLQIQTLEGSVPDLWHELGQLWDLPDPLGFLRHYLQRYKQNFLGSLKANL